MNHTRFPKEKHLPYCEDRDNKDRKGDRVEGGKPFIPPSGGFGEGTIIQTLQYVQAVHVATCVCSFVTDSCHFTLTSLTVNCH